MRAVFICGSGIVAMVLLAVALLVGASCDRTVRRLGCVQYGGTAAECRARLP